MRDFMIILDFLGIGILLLWGFILFIIEVIICIGEDK